jgi:hypothetical protein
MVQAECGVAGIQTVRQEDAHFILILHDIDFCVLPNANVEASRSR